MGDNILHFTKMHGAGNDFVVIDATHEPFELTTAHIRYIADRHFGVGCDQLLVVEPYTGEDAEFRYRIFNADGGEVEQCGNGARCFARFVYDNKLTKNTTIPVMTAAGRIVLQVQADGNVTVNMGIPELTPSKIPCDFIERKTVYTLNIEEQAIQFSAVSMGNPHAVLTVSDVDMAPVLELGSIIEQHPVFPKRVNVGFMQVLSADSIRLRVFERGAGETLACGTGACAAVVAGRIQGLLNETVHVALGGGELTIKWLGEGNPVWMTGPAVTVFKGTIQL